MSSVAWRSAPALVLVFAGPTLAACSTDEPAEPSGATSPPASSSAPTPESSESPTEVPTEELGGPTLDQGGVLMTLPEGFPPDTEGLSTQQTSINPDGLYAALSTLGTVAVPSRREQEDEVVGNPEMSQPATLGEDVEIGGVPFLHAWGDYATRTELRFDYYRAFTQELIIGIRLTTPNQWSEEQREAYLQPILDSVVVP